MAGSARLVPAREVDPARRSAGPGARGLVSEGARRPVDAAVDGAGVPEPGAAASQPAPWAVDVASSGPARQPAAGRSRDRASRRIERRCPVGPASAPRRWTVVVSRGRGSTDRPPVRRGGIRAAVSRPWHRRGQEDRRPAARERERCPEPSTARTIRARRMSAPRRCCGGQVPRGRCHRPTPYPMTRIRNVRTPKPTQNSTDTHARCRVHLRVLERRAACALRSERPSAGTGAGRASRGR